MKAHPSASFAVKITNEQGGQANQLTLLDNIPNLWLIRVLDGHFWHQK
jgi:hypothetical protein